MPSYLTVLFQPLTAGFVVVPLVSTAIVPSAAVFALAVTLRTPVFVIALPLTLIPVPAIYSLPAYNQFVPSYTNTTGTSFFHIAADMSLVSVVEPLYLTAFAPLPFKFKVILVPDVAVVAGLTTIVIPAVGAAVMLDIVTVFAVDVAPPTPLP